MFPQIFTECDRALKESNVRDRQSFFAMHYHRTKLHKEVKTLPEYEDYHIKITSDKNNVTIGFICHWDIMN